MIGFDVKPNFIIGEIENPYLKRWYVIPRNPVFNIYLHQILRSDDPRALHDHPYWCLSIILRGGYWEVRPGPELHSLATYWRGPGSVIARLAKSPHRLEVMPSKPAWTIFITGPRFREWGFHCHQGWRHWSEYAKKENGVSTVSKGCGD